MKNTLKFVSIVIGTLFVFFVSMQSLPATDNREAPRQMTPTPLPANPVAKEHQPDINALPFQDDPEIYKYDDPTSVVTIYVTVRKGNAADRTDFTWDEVNSFSKWFYTDNTVAQVGMVEAIVQFGDESGPVQGELGYDAVVPNATIQIRGASTSLMPQKSYKIELNQTAGSWRGQTTIALNKHIFDPSRIRNKLNFDLIKQIPNMVSLRTQFVHLYVKDQTTDPWETRFVDYGLFTQIELPNKTFLKNHRLDPDGQLYKTTFFEFSRYPDQIRLVDDPLFDENQFASRLEIKGNDDNSKLIHMLDDLQDPNIPIENTFDEYFDSDNYFTWLAYNILVGNVDTQSQNFYLYSPGNSHKFYFIPWDYDDSFFRQDRIKCCNYYPYNKFEFGVANYWGAHLPSRLLRNPDYRQILDEKINELRSFLTPERIREMVEQYKPVAEEYALRMPDVQYFPTTKQGMELDFDLMPSEIELNYELYLQSLKTPMPFYLGVPAVNEDVLSFTWDEAYDFGAQNITYQFQVARDWDFQDIVFETTKMNLTSSETEMPQPGGYFWRVIATNEAGETQYSFDIFFDSTGYPHSGMKRFEVTNDGEVVEK